MTGSARVGRVVNEENFATGGWHREPLLAKCKEAKTDRYHSLMLRILTRDNEILKGDPGEVND